MATMAIERDDWKPFFDSFARRHNGWFVTVEVLMSEYGDQVEVEDLRLSNISVETTDADKIEITVVGRDERHLTRIIEAPRQIWLKEQESGADEVLEIEAQDTVTLLYFHPETAPERANA